jgi:BASS family bile acid:Na+ symporter
MSKKINFILLVCIGLLILSALVFYLNDDFYFAKITCTISVIAFAIFCGMHKNLKGYQYTAFIIVAVILGMFYNEHFANIGSLTKENKKLLMLTIIQLVMFGTGTQMSLKEFTGIGSTGKGVAIGLLCHFTIMPIVGLLLTKIFNFEPEIAAGIILIGSCSSGLASNVMVYLAKGNLVLSVFVTAFATLIAPFLTPLLMKLLAGKLVPLNFVDMMMEIIKIVIVPIGAALLHDFSKTATSKQKQNIFIVGAIVLTWIIISKLIFKENALTNNAYAYIVLSQYFAGAIVFGIAYNFLFTQFKNLDKWMPKISMFGIFYFTLVTTAAGKENLMKVGVLLLLASIIHNLAGYFFGYWLSRVFKLNKTDAQTIAFEVGLQNGGMASGIASGMGKIGTVGLPAAVFSPWMNISGSILANYWRKRQLVIENKK